MEVLRMKEEVMRILKMVEDGKISSEKGAELIEAIGANKPEQQLANAYKDKMLKIRVNDKDDKVEVNLPIKFVKAAGGSVLKMSMMNKGNCMEGVDMQAILDAIDNSIEGKIVDVKSSNGETVEIYIE